MAKNDFSIRVEIDDIVKVTCFETLCKYNLYNNRTTERSNLCGLKHIEISPGANCRNFESLKGEPPVTCGKGKVDGE